MCDCLLLHILTSYPDTGLLCLATACTGCLLLPGLPSHSTADYCQISTQIEHNNTEYNVENVNFAKYRPTYFTSI